MDTLLKLLAEIEDNKNCIVSKSNNPLSRSFFDYELPLDLKYYLENYSSIVLFKDMDYSIKIVGLSEFKRSNLIIVGEDVEDDISHNWYIIADDGNSQYITIDLSKQRLGRCYDSFWDIHGLPGNQPIIAKGFTELLERLYLAKGKSFYWKEPGFKFYGDAYDDV
jgi:hypothetical protein